MDVMTHNFMNTNLHPFLGYMAHKSVITLRMITSLLILFYASKVFLFVTIFSILNQVYTISEKS